MQADVRDTEPLDMDLDLPGPPKPRSSYWVVGWIILLVLVALIVWVLHSIDIELPTVDSLETLDPGTTFTGDHGEVRFPVAGEGWERIQPGVFGDEDTAYEFRGPHESAHIVINDFPDNTLDEVVAWRKSMAHDDMHQSACEEHRTLAGRALSVVSHYTCWGRSAGEPAVWAGTVVETDQGVHEMLGYLNTPEGSFGRLEPEMRVMVGGFEAP
ncbi:hypothetical protein ACJO2E_15760 [Marinobacter sp. M1N3S26]|uniref:hypothetical protein n=1 Tax=Marinobacter sp. M1N3S26 TaxID=3382299 RepID=UPI00387A9F18